MSTERVPDAPIDAQFLERWSPRAFASDPLSDEQVAALFEAARWAPSCFNEQPWLFAIAREPEDHARMASILMEGNRTWAEKAPLLGIVFGRRNFGRDGKPNRWANFDTGAASMSLSLQAAKMGLVTHFMGGFSQEAAYEQLGISEQDFEALAAFAIGRQGSSTDLPANLAQREAPSSRNPVSEFLIEGRLESGA